jgi:hypothetical protein
MLSYRSLCSHSHCSVTSLTDLSLHLLLFLCPITIALAIDHGLSKILFYNSTFYNMDLLLQRHIWTWSIIEMTPWNNTMPIHVTFFLSRHCACMFANLDFIDHGKPIDLQFHHGIKYAWLFNDDVSSMTTNHSKFSWIDALNIRLWASETASFVQTKTP